MDRDKAIRAAKLTLGGMLEKNRHATAVGRAGGQVAPSKYLPNVPRAVHADGGEVEQKRDFQNDNPGGEWLEGKQARAAQYPDDKFMVGATTGVIGGRSSMFLPTHVLKGIAGLNDEVRTSGVHKYDSLLSDAREGGFDPEQKGNKVVVAVNHYGQPYLLEGNTRVAVAHSMGIPKVKAEVRYWNGAENVDGPMHPEKVFGMASDNPDITKADGGEVDGITAYHASPEDIVGQFRPSARDVGIHFAANPDLAHNAAVKSLMGRPDMAGKVSPKAFKINARPEQIVDIPAASNRFDFYDILEHLHGTGRIDSDTFNSTFDGLQDIEDKISHPDETMKAQNALFSKAMSKSNIKALRYMNRFDAGPTWRDMEEGRMTSPVTPDHSYIVTDPSAIQHQNITKAEGGAVTDNDNFRNWFGNSVTHTDGQPHVFYTGTSKDKDFTSFNVGRHGAWFTRDPAEASAYAEVNDSQGYKRDGWTVTPTNTASRVIPAYVKAENPYTGDLPDEYMRDNYKKAHSDWFDTLRAKGHDSWIPSSQNGNVVVALKEPQQIKSIFNNGKFDPNQKHMNKATGGQVMGYVPMATLPVSRLAVARAPQYQQQAPVARFSESLNSLMDTVEGFKKKPDTAVDSPSAATEGHAPQGISEAATAAYGKLVDAYGQPLTINSAYRDPQKNEEVGGAKGSQHTHGNAYDIDVSNMPHEERVALANLAWDSGFRGIGFYDNSLHFDVGDPRGWGPSHSRDSIPEWAQPFTEERYGYSGGGSAMDDDNQDTSGGNNVESLSLARSLRNINSDEHTDPVKNIFANLTAGQKEAQKGYEMAHANGEFDDFKIGDTFVYKHAANPTPMKIIGFSMRHADSFPQGKRVYNNHVPALDMEDQIAGKKVNKYAVEWFKDNLHKYDFVSGKPRAVKAGGGSMDDNNQNGEMENGATPINFATRPQAGELPDAGGIRGGAGVLQAQNEAPLEGLPQKIVIPMTGQIIQASADPRIRQVARDYMAQAGLPYSPPTKYARVDPKRAARIASDYTNMEDNPDDPLTKASYNAMIKETMDQYHAAKKSGLNIEFWNPRKQEDPYKASPRLATEDIRNNHHMWVFPTYSGYGSGEPISEDDAKKNPLLQLTGETWNGIPVTVNDVFRAIHDYYGHAKEGLGFRADGEENAWRAHASMFSPLARMAMTSETRGQNSWLNYGPHGEHNRKARTEDTIFAPQKIGVMSHLSHHEGAEDFITPEDISFMASIRKRFGKKLGGAVEKALALTRRFTKDGKSAISALKPKGK